MKKKYIDSPPKTYFDDNPKLDKLLLTLLYNRGIKTKKDISEFLENDKYEDAYLFPDMQKFVERIHDALKKQEKVAIHGDYDVDGVSATSIMYLYLKDVLGLKNVEVFIPSRYTDGYGISKSTIDKFSESKITLLITVDCGIKDVEEISYAMSLGIDVVISDHHTPGVSIPSAFCIIHPKDYVCKYLSGSAVAFKMTQALDKSFEKNKSDDFVDLAGLGIICDVMPLVGENRVIVKNALKRLRDNKRIGLEKLFEIANIEKEIIDVYHIGYVIGPRLNASGRMNSALESFNLLSANDPINAKNHAIALHTMNSKRQDDMNKAIDEAKKLIDENAFINILYMPQVSLGVIGLVSGKLKETTNRPIIVFTDDGDLLSGSARSIDEFHIVKALDNFSSMFFSYGGHAKAAGLKIKKESYEEFKNAIQEFAKSQLSDQNIDKSILIDTTLPLLESNLENIFDNITKLEPFGESNPRPVFESDAFVDRVMRMGENGKHLKLFIKPLIDSYSLPIEAVGFYMGDRTIKDGDKVNLVYNVSKNVWNNRITYQMQLIDFTLI